MYGILRGYSIVKTPYKGNWLTVGKFGNDNMAVEIMTDEATNEDSDDNGGHDNSGSGSGGRNSSSKSSSTTSLCIQSSHRSLLIHLSALPTSGT
jgi:hypothetical protein